MVSYFWRSRSVQDLSEVVRTACYEFKSLYNHSVPPIGSLSAPGLRNKHGPAQVLIVPSVDPKAKFEKHFSGAGFKEEK